VLSRPAGRPLDLVDRQSVAHDRLFVPGDAQSARPRRAWRGRIQGLGVISFTRQFLRGQRGETMRALAAALFGVTAAFLAAGIAVHLAIGQAQARSVTMRLLEAS